MFCSNRLGITEAGSSDEVGISSASQRPAGCPMVPSYVDSNADPEYVPGHCQVQRCTKINRYGLRARNISYLPITIIASKSLMLVSRTGKLSKKRVNKVKRHRARGRGDC